MRALVITLLLTTMLCAQEYRGTFSGSVTDAQGAAIAKARIVVTEKRTGSKSEATSESSGAYTIPFLAPGEYEISAQAPGFKRFVRSGVSLGMGEHPVIDIKLDVGSVSESVTVTAEAPLMDAANASIGQVITTEEVESMPTNGGTPLMLAQLALGAISTVEPGTQVRPFDNNTPGSFSLGGATSGTNELLYNGAPNNAFRSQLAYSPPRDAAQQVRVNIFESDSSFGHTGGGTANVITKSGTNSLRGSLYEFNQVSALAANQFFYNARSVPRPIYRYNQYGLAVGGPLWIPKVFNGKNKLFWFFAWEGLKDSDPANSPRETGNPVNFATVPTAAERQGDFSALLKANKPAGCVPGGSPTCTTDYTIFDPATGVPTSGRVGRTPFPNNVIPTSRLNPVALKYMQYWPNPNIAGDPSGFQNYLVNINDSDTYDNELARLDVNLNDKNKLSADFHHSFRTQLKNQYFPNVSQGNYLFRKNQGAALDDVYNIAPSLFADVRGAWTRFYEQTSYLSDDFDPASLGFPAYVNTNSQSLMMPRVIFQSTSVNGGSEPSFQDLGPNGDTHLMFDIFQLFGSVVKLHGNHTIKTGADLRDYRWSNFNPGNSAGTYTFNSNWTNGPLNNAAAAPLGQDLAAFLLGLPSSGSIDLNAQNTMASHYYGFFVQDDWRARPNLTLNLGVRFERETPVQERYYRNVNGFDPTAQNVVAAAAAAAYKLAPITQIPGVQFNALGGLTFSSAGDPGAYHIESHPISPRIGFAWTPSALGGKTVVRGGFSINIVPIEIAGNGYTNSGSTVSLNQQGFSQTTPVNQTIDSYLTPNAPGTGTLSNPFPGGIQHPAGAANGVNTFLGQSITFFNPHIRNPYDIRWDVGIQRELPGQMVLEVAYIGNHGVHLPINKQLDFIPRQYLSTQIFRDTTTINLLGTSVTNPFRGLLPGSSSSVYTSTTVSLSSLLVPYPQYGTNNVTMQGTNAGSSYFESLNIGLRKRMTNGLTIINNFVYSMLIERLSYLNDSDFAPEKRVSSDSRPFRNALSAIYALPIGRGKRLNLQSSLSNTLLGGWQLNGNLIFQTGQVITGWGNVIYLGSPLNLNPYEVNSPAFNTAAFVTASTLQPSQNIRYFDTQFGNLRRDWSKNLDLSVSKDFKFAERRSLQFRFETFNTTNRVTFGAPATGVTSSTFGIISSQANQPRAVQLGARLVF